LNGNERQKTISFAALGGQNVDTVEAAFSYAPAAARVMIAPRPHLRVEQARTHPMGGFHARHVHAVPLRFLAETIRRFRFAPEMSDEGPKLLNLLDTWGSEHWSAKTQKANIELLRDRLKIVDAENASLQKRVVELERDLKTAKDALAQMHQHNVELRANAEQPSVEDKLTRGHIKVLALIGKSGRASDEAVMNKLKPVSRAEVR
jgi:hypothetical protein